MGDELAPRRCRTSGVPNAVFLLSPPVKKALSIRELFLHFCGRGDLRFLPHVGQRLAE